MVSDRDRDARFDGERDLAAELRLRPERPPVTRLSRKVLIALTAVAVSVVSTALIWALSQGRGGPPGSTELYNTEKKPAPDGLNTLPRDYAGLPRNVPALGPPLPGDLGRPILTAQRGDPPGPGVDPELQRLAQETEAARTSRLFAAAQGTERATQPTPLPTPSSPDQPLGSRSSRPQSIARPSAPIGWPIRPRAMSCRPALSFRLPSSPGSAPTYRARSRPK